MRKLRIAVDVSLAVVAGLIGSMLTVADPNLDHKHVAAPTWVYVLAQLVAAAMLLVRRRFPFTATFTIAAVNLFAPAWASFLIPYAVTAYGKGRRWRQWAAVVTLAGAFLAAGLVDRVVGYVAPKLLGAGTTALVGAGVTTIGDAIALDLTDITLIGPDLRFTAMLHANEF